MRKVLILITTILLLALVIPGVMAENSNYLTVDAISYYSSKLGLSIVKLIWLDPSEPVKEYRVYRLNDTTGEFVLLKKIRVGYHNYIDKVPANGTYIYKIEAFLKDGNIARAILKVKVPMNIVRVWPSEAPVKKCYGSKGAVNSTGPNSATWFKYGGCGNWKVFNVTPGILTLLDAYGDECPSCPGCVLGDIYFEIYEWNGNDWRLTGIVKGPQSYCRDYPVYYIPNSSRIMIKALKGFYISVYQLPQGRDVEVIEGSLINMTPQLPNKKEKNPNTAARETQTRTVTTIIKESTTAKESTTYRESAPTASVFEIPKWAKVGNWVRFRLEFKAEGQGKKAEGSFEWTFEIIDVDEHGFKVKAKDIKTSGDLGLIQTQLSQLEGFEWKFKWEQEPLCTPFNFFGVYASPQKLSEDGEVKNGDTVCMFDKDTGWLKKLSSKYEFGGYKQEVEISIVDSNFLKSSGGGKICGTGFIVLLSLLLLGRR